MKIDKLSGTDAFIVIDLYEATTSAGVVRIAPKVLQGSTIALARTATYTFALRGLQIGGASAGISADAGGRDAALAAFVAEVQPRIEQGDLVLDAGSGVSATALADFAAHDTRNPVRLELVDGITLDEHLGALGPVVAAEAALGGLDGRTAAVELGPSALPLIRELVARGVTVVAAGSGAGVAHAADGLDIDTLIGADGDLASLGVDLQPPAALSTIEASVLFCGSRQGMIDGEAAEALGAQVVVPTGCQPISAKGLAVLRRRDVVALADFVTTSGPTFAGWPAGDATSDAIIAAATDAITASVTGTLDHPEGPLLGACYQAEAFLASWQETRPFGRPIA